MEKVMTYILMALGIVGLVLLLSFLLSWPVYMLWNGCLVPAVTGLHEVSWLQAWGITVVCNILFKTSVSNNKK
jgi:hypothetical protein